MTPADVEKLRTLTEIARRYRRENDRLREQAGLESQASKAFDQENVELFEVVHRNHEMRS